MKFIKFNNFFTTDCEFPFLVVVIIYVNQFFQSVVVDGGGNEYLELIYENLLSLGIPNDIQHSHHAINKSISSSNQHKILLAITQLFHHNCVHILSISLFLYRISLISFSSLCCVATVAECKLFSHPLTNYSLLNNCEGSLCSLYSHGY